MVLLEKITKGISSGVGLAGEKYQDHKNRKAALTEQKDQSDTAETGQSSKPVKSANQEDVAEDERIWALDEISELPDYETSQAQHTSEPERTIEDLVNDVTKMRVDGQVRAAQGTRLPYPIIIPQRRPGTKGRGFARAYPPVLEVRGIDQETFMTFLQSFENAQQASPWLKAICMAGDVVGLVPGTITMAVSMSVSITAGSAMVVQKRYKANAFLDKMNKEIFMPLGLYAMVLMCKDTASKPGEIEFGEEDVNMETAKQVTKWGLPQVEGGESSDLSTTTKMYRKVRVTSGHTNADAMPLEVAPLIYPGLEDMLERPEVERDESFKARLMRNKDFVAEYFDRRAQAEYAGNNPGSALSKASGSTHKFSNRYADPNHACNNGHLFSLVTGGQVVAQPRRRNRRLREVGADGKLMPKVKEDQKIRGPIGLITYPFKKVLQPNVLYLTIVDLPSEQEMAEAKAILESEKEEKGNMFDQAMQARSEMHANRGGRRGNGVLGGSMPSDSDVPARRGLLGGRGLFGGRGLRGGRGR